LSILESFFFFSLRILFMIWIKLIVCGVYMKKLVYYHDINSSELITLSELSGMRLTTICLLIVSNLYSLTS
jgi:hypothetical protein